MSVSVIHLVNNLSKINFGIWNAAVFASEQLHLQHNVTSYLLVCEEPPAPDIQKSLTGVVIFYIGTRNPFQKACEYCREHSLDVDNTLFVTHGCWQMPTRLGARLKRIGYRWVCVPHGMLEPWSMQQKKWKKFIYFTLFEKQLIAHADCVRAVSQVEAENLEAIFHKSIWVIENGVTMPPYKSKPRGEKLFIFMARLHHKKGIEPLVRAWLSVMSDCNKNRLVIAGPDEGEWPKIKSLVNQNPVSNIEYVGPIYGEDKNVLLQRAHYFALPSHSEGFPTSVVEAMSYAVVPLISKGCNFPAVFQEELGYNIEPDQESIAAVLNRLKDDSFDQERAERNRIYIENHNADTHIANELMSLYRTVLKD